MSTSVSRYRFLFVLGILSFASWSICSPAQTVTLTPNLLTFTSQVLGTSSSSKAVTLKNTGRSTLNISSMVASGGFATTSCPSSIAAGATCQFNVSFAPGTLGPVNGAITIVDSANPSTQVLNLTGTGIAPVTFSAASISFSSTAIGSTSAPKSITLTNQLATSITMGAVATSGDFNVSSNGCTGSVAGGGTCTIAVTFSPTLKGTISGALTVGDSAPFQPQVVALSGSGTGTVTNPVSLQPTKLTFTSQTIGTTSASQTVTLKNNGTSILSIATVAVSGNYLETDNCAGKNIASRATCTINVQFQPTGDGSIAGAITVTDSAATSPQTAALTGTGSGSFSFSPASLSFGLETLNLVSSPLTASLVNNSGADVSLTGIAISGDYTQTNNCGATLLANSSCTFNVTYTPGIAGTTDGAITVTGSGTQGTQVLSLSGAGINPSRYAYSMIQNLVEAYATDPASGNLRLTALQTLPDVCGSNNVATVAPSGKFYYVPSVSACHANDPFGVFGYTIAANGQLTPISGSPFNLGSAYPYDLFITPNGKFGYLSDVSTNPYTIIPASINTQTGVMTQLSGTIQYPGNGLPSGTIDPASKFLFLSDSNEAVVYAYMINASTGALTAVPGSPFATNGNGTYQLAVHPSGKFLVTNSLSGPSVFKINTQTGALTLVPGSPFSAYPSAYVVLDPSGNFVYTAQATTTLTIFRLNATTGALTQIPGSPFTMGGIYNQGFYTDPSGHFLYLATTVPGGGTPVLQVLSVNGQSGVPTALNVVGTAPFESPYLNGFTTGAKPVSFTSTYAYVANSPVSGASSQNGIQQYSINSSTGMLTPVGAQFSESNGPQVLALQPKQQYLYASQANGNVIYGYDFMSGGALNRIALAQESVTYPTYSIVSDPAGAWLFGTDPAPYPTGDAALWQINSDGSLGSIPFGQYYFSGPGVAITASPTQYGVLAISSDGVLWGLYDPSNTGAMWGSFAVGNSPSALSFDGVGRFFYVANSGDNTISGFASNGNTMNSLNGGVPFATGTTPTAIAGDPWGHYLYVANSGSQDIWEYSIDPLLGTLTPLSASPLSLGASPNSLGFDNSGKFLYATNSAAGTISVMSLNSDGTLTLQGTVTVDSGGVQSPAPTSIAVTGTNQ